jgi:glycosyltransferase involved in cell wall biosynthesis
MKKDKILFIKKYSANPKFMTNDFEILSEKYDVILNNVKTTNNIFIIFTLIKEFFYLLFNIWRYKAVYIWFADYHSFLPVLFARLAGKKSVICAGGYECTYIPEINCGVFTNVSFSKRIRAFCVTYSLKKCSLILPVDESLIENTNNYIYSDIPGKSPLRDGIKNFIPDIKTPMETLYLGYHTDVFKRTVDSPKANTVISAGLIVNDDEYRRKGFDILVRAAGVMKDVKFVLIGLNEEFCSKLAALNLKNIELHNIVSYDKLIEEYSKAKVFAQISMFEGMPSTICEAMMCECIPVGSDVNGIPNIIGNTGILVHKKSSEEVIKSLYEALALGDENGKKARQRIIENFSLEKRKIRLHQILDKLLQKS